MKIIFIIFSIFISTFTLANNLTEKVNTEPENNAPKKINSEFKVYFGFSNYIESMVIPDSKVLNFNFKDSTRGIGLGYGFEFFRSYRISTTSSVNISHFRNDLDHSIRTDHYRANLNSASFEQKINLNFEFDEIQLKPYISGGYGYYQAKSSYRYFLSEFNNQYLRSKELGTFTKASVGVSVLDLSKELFSFIEYSAYYPQKSTQKLELRDNLNESNNANYKLTHQNHGPNYQIVIGAGATF